MNSRIVRDWTLWEATEEAKLKIDNPHRFDVDYAEDYPKNATYPFQAMKVGESFVVGLTAFGGATLTKLRQSVHYYNKVNKPKKFSVTVHETEERSGYEVTRIN